MNRRAVLVGVGTILSGAFSGCLGRLETGTTEISDVEFETGVDVDETFDDDPTVDFASDAVRVTGRYSVGDGCHSPRLREPTYDDETDELRIRVDREHDGSDECDLVEQRVSYRVVVTVDGPFPGVVDVTETVGGETRAERGLLPF